MDLYGLIPLPVLLSFNVFYASPICVVMCDFMLGRYTLLCLFVYRFVLFLCLSLPSDMCFYVPSCAWLIVCFSVVFTLANSC